MNDIHIRAILLIVIGIVSIGGAAGFKFAGATGAGIGLLFLVGLAAFVVAGVVLLFADAEGSE